MKLYVRLIPMLIALGSLFLVTGCTDADSILTQLTGLSSDSGTGSINGKVTIPYLSKTDGSDSGVISVSLLQTNIKTECDSEGLFSLSLVPAGSYQLMASIGTSYKTVRNSVSVSSGETTMIDNFFLARTGMVSGRVLIDGAEEFSGIRVKEMYTGTEVFTDAAGSYSIAGLPPGLWSLSFSKSGFNEITRSSVAVTSDATTQLSDVILSKIGAVTDIVSVATNLPGEMSISVSSRGDRIVFSYPSQVSGVSDAYVCDLDGSDLTAVASDAADETGPVWASSDNFVVYSKAGSVFSVNPKSPAQVSLLVSNGEDPFWNAVTGKLLFSRNGGVWAMNGLDGVDSAAAVANIGSNPVQEPNSGKILYTKGNEIWLMDGSGNNQTMVASQGRRPCWTSSQYEILYEWDGDIYRKNVMSSTSYKVVSGGVAPAWIPSQSKVVFYSPEAGRIRMMQL